MSEPLSLIDVIKAKVGCFRISDSQEVLQQLGLPKTGRKADLCARILDVFHDAAVLNARGYVLQDQPRVNAAARIVDTVFQRLVAQGQPTAVTASRQLRARGADAAAALASGGGGNAAAAAAGEQQQPQRQPADGQANKRQRLGAGAGSPTGLALLPARRQFVLPGPGGSGGVLQDGGDDDDVVEAFLSGQLDAAGPANTRVRCVCSEHVAREPMLQCEGAFCGVWQHAGCVRQRLAHAPVQPGTEVWAARRHFFCERCRLARADPFWELFDALVSAPAPGKLTGQERMLPAYPSQELAPVATSSTGARPVLLSQQHLQLLQQQAGEYELHAASLQLDDEVQFRVHWPVACSLRFGSKLLRPTNRAQGAKLGPMQRDAPANLSQCLGAAGLQESGSHLRGEVCMDYTDPSRAFVLCTYVARRRSKEQVKALMKQQETLGAALQRVRQQVGGGKKPSGGAPAAGAAPAAAAAGGPGDATAIEDEDDDDDDIVCGNTVVSLRDPNTLLRIATPARFTDTGVTELAAFDLDAFLDVAARTAKWLDPHSMRSSSVQHLQVDAYLSHILQCLASCPDVLEVEVDAQGGWRPAGLASCPFMSVLDPLPQAAAAARAAVAAASGAGGGGSSSGDEEDEREELRRATAEARRGAAPEVIELLSSSDDEGEPGAAPPPRQQQQQQPHHHQQQQRAPLGQQQQYALPVTGLRINMPARPQQHPPQAHMHPAGGGVVVPGYAAAPGAAAGGGPHGLVSPRMVGLPHQQHQHQQQQHWQAPPQQVALPGGLARQPSVPLYAASNQQQPYLQQQGSMPLPPQQQYYGAPRPQTVLVYGQQPPAMGGLLPQGSHHLQPAPLMQQPSIDGQQQQQMYLQQQQQHQQGPVYRQYG